MTAVHLDVEFPTLERVGVVARTLDEAAEQFIEQGFAYIGYDGRKHTKLPACLLEFVSSKSPEELRAWMFDGELRPDGCHDPNIGYIRGRTNAGKDDKHLIHWHPKLHKMLTARDVSISSVDEILLRECLDVYLEHRALMEAFTRTLDRKNHFRFSFFERIENALNHDALGTPYPTAQAVLRLGCYPMQDGQEIGKLHVDRNMLTLHSGGLCGKLAAVVGDRLVDVSPEEGSILVFPGVKAENIADCFGQKFQALIHGALRDDTATVSEDILRAFIVSFWHDKQVVWDSPKIFNPELWTSLQTV